MPIDPNNDPNEAFELGTCRLRRTTGGLSSAMGSRCITLHRATRQRAERYCRDPAWRLGLERKYIHG
jgi:hypothetical protein